MATSRYRRINEEDAVTSDAKLHEVELHLLDKIMTSSSPSSVRNYAEAYALIRGLVTGTSNVEVKAS